MWFENTTVLVGNLLCIAAAIYAVRRVGGVASWVLLAGLILTALPALAMLSDSVQEALSAATTGMLESHQSYYASLPLWFKLLMHGGQLDLLLEALGIFMLVRAFGSTTYNKSLNFTPPAAQAPSDAANRRAG